jgi:hypothetical protein
MARSTYEASNFSRVVTLNGREGEYFLVRKAQTKSRVIPVGDLSGSGELVATADILTEVAYTAPIAETSEAAAGTPEVDTPETPVEAPVEPAPEAEVTEAPVVEETAAAV